MVVQAFLTLRFIHLSWSLKFSGLWCSSSVWNEHYFSQGVWQFSSIFVSVLSQSCIDIPIYYDYLNESCICRSQWNIFRVILWIYTVVHRCDANTYFLCMTDIRRRNTSIMQFLQFAKLLSIRLYMLPVNNN